MDNSRHTGPRPGRQGQEDSTYPAEDSISREGTRTYHEGSTETSSDELEKDKSELDERESESNGSRLNEVEKGQFASGIRQVVIETNPSLGRDLIRGITNRTQSMDSVADNAGVYGGIILKTVHPDPLSRGTAKTKIFM